MNLIFRLLAQLFFHLKNTEVKGAESTSTLNYRVWPTDSAFSIDHLTNSRVASFADLGRMHWLAQAGFWQPMRDANILPVISAQQNSFFGMIPLFQTFDLRTELVYWDQKYCYFEYKFMQGDKLRIVHLARIAFLDTKAKKAIGFAQTIEQLGLSIEARECPKNIADWQQSLSNRY